MQVARRYVLPFLAFAGMAIAWTFPLVLYLTDRLPGEVAGDNLSFLWNLWWMRQAGSGFFSTPLLFAPFGTDLALHTHTALQAAFAATVLRPLDIVVAQNLIILLTLTLNGFAAYLLALDRTGDPVASLPAGLAFGGSAYVSAHLLGHFSLISVWTLPLFILCLLRAIERRSRTWAVVTGLSLLGVAYTDYYYTVYCLVIAAALTLSGTGLATMAFRPRSLHPQAWRGLAFLFVAIVAAIAAILATGGIDGTVAGVRIRATEPGNLLTAGWVVAGTIIWLRLRPRLVPIREGAMSRVGARIRVMAPGGMLFALGMLPVLRHVFRLWASGDYVAPVHLWRSGPAGLDLVALFAGNPFHPVTGAMTSGLYARLGLDRVEGVGWLGVVPTAVLGWALWRACARRDVSRALLGGAFFFIWSLGPWLTAWGVNLGLLLPANLFGLVPVLSNARMPGRAIVVTLLAASLLLARYLAAVPRPRRLALAGGAAMLIAVDLLPAPYPLIAMTTPSIYTAIPPGEGAVLELPMGFRDGFEQQGRFDDRTLQYQMVHGHPLVGGFAARIAPSIKAGYADLPLVRSLLRLSDPDEAGPDERDAGMSRADAATALRDASVRFVVLDGARASAALKAFVEATLPLTPLARDGERQLFELAE